MKHYRFYIYTALSVSILFALISVIAVPYFVRLSTTSTLSSQISAAQQEAQMLATTSEGMLTQGIANQTAIQTMQQSIGNSAEREVFNSIMDWSGKYLCYPDKTKVGTPAPQGNGLISGMEDKLKPEDLYKMIFAKADTISDATAIIHLTPVKNYDWIVASHINKDSVIDKAKTLSHQLYIVFLIIGLLTLILVLGLIRLLSSYYESQLNLRSIKFEDGVLNLSKLNTSLEKYQRNLEEFKENNSGTEPTLSENENVKEVTKQRILTYVRNELMPIATEDIAYIYVENTITYVVRTDGKRSTTNESLDQIYSYLDAQSFFRANRQIIVAISAIDKITKFGNSQLKIQLNPTSEIDIIIGKNKAAAFKQWLDL